MGMQYHYGARTDKGETNEKKHSNGMPNEGHYVSTYFDGSIGSPL